MDSLCDCFNRNFLSDVLCIITFDTHKVNVRIRKCAQQKKKLITFDSRSNETIRKLSCAHDKKEEIFLYKYIDMVNIIFGY